jgi:hypothetical protein
MKQLLFTTALFSLLFVSCAEPKDDRATAVCDCYKLLHRVGADEVEVMNFIADSCQTLHIEVLKELEGNPEEKELFDEAYEFCQNEK